MGAAVQYIGRIHTPYQMIGACPNNIGYKSGPLCQLLLDIKQAILLEG